MKKLRNKAYWKGKGYTVYKKGLTRIIKGIKSDRNVITVRYSGGRYQAFKTMGGNYRFVAGRI